MLKWLELKIPPLFLTLIFGILMWWASKKFNNLSFDNLFLKTMSIMIFIFGIVIALIAVGLFRKEDTTVDPTNPKNSSSLVTNGIYGYTRNPMYLGFLSWLLGFGLFIGNPINLLFVVIFLVYMNEFQIKPEESTLCELFGEEYIEYKSRVKRWI
jgi:protein-S-isoprenylcysteine O-methyltransferase Ste14